MLTDDKARAGGNKSLKDNVNSRDQRSAGIILLVLTGIFLAFLISLGLSHAPQHQTAESTGVAGPGGTGHASNDHNFDINRPVGYLDLPGTIGKPQKFTIHGVGNTPAPFTAKPQQGTASDTVPPAKPEAAPATPAAH